MYKVLSLFSTYKRAFCRNSLASTLTFEELKGGRRVVFVWKGERTRGWGGKAKGEKTLTFISTTSSLPVRCIVLNFFKFFSFRYFQKLCIMHSRFYFSSLIFFPGYAIFFSNFFPLYIRFSFSFFFPVSVFVIFLFYSWQIHTANFSEAKMYLFRFFRFAVFLAIFWTEITTILTPSNSEGGEWGRLG